MRSYKILFLSLFSIIACKQQQTKKADEQLPLVHVVNPMPEYITDTVSSSGIIASSRESILSFKNPGIVEQVFVNEGDFVKKGQLLAVLNSSELILQADQANLKTMQYESELGRMRQLLKDTIITIEQFQQTQTALATSQSQKKALEYNIKSGLLHAPEAGIIVRRNVNPGEFKPSSGEVFRLGSNEVASRWVFRFSVTDKDRIKLRKGQKAILKLDALPGRQLKGNLYKMSELPNSSTSTYDCYISFDPGSTQIVYGLTGKVSLPALTGKTFNTLPLSALSEMDGKYSRILTVDKNGIAHLKTIEIFGINNGRAIVADTMQKGLRVINEGKNNAEDGKRVNISKKETK